MASSVKYVIDEKGQITSVKVPLHTWTKINNDFSTLQNKLNVLMGLKSAFQEVKLSKQTRRKLHTLKDFLSESKG